jgi:hypothetical protein
VAHFNLVKLPFIDDKGHFFRAWRNSLFRFSVLSSWKQLPYRKHEETPLLAAFSEPPSGTLWDSPVKACRNSAGVGCSAR